MKSAKRGHQAWKENCHVVWLSTSTFKFWKERKKKLRFQGELTIDLAPVHVTRTSYVIKNKNLGKQDSDTITIRVLQQETDTLNRI